MWYVYIIKCDDDTFYTGITTDVIRRLNEHNNGKGGNYTRVRYPVKLVYKENHCNRSEALKRENQIKRWTKQKKIALISRDVLYLHEFSKFTD